MGRGFHRALSVGGRQARIEARGELVCIVGRDGRGEGMLDGVDYGGRRDEERGRVHAQNRVRDDLNIADGGVEVSMSLSRGVPFGDCGSGSDGL